MVPFWIQSYLSVSQTCRAEQNIPGLFQLVPWSRTIASCIQTISGLLPGTLTSSAAAMLVSTEIKPTSPSCTSPSEASSQSLQECSFSCASETDGAQGQQDMGSKWQLLNVSMLFLFCICMSACMKSSHLPKWKFDKHSYIYVFINVWQNSSDPDEIESASPPQKPSFYTGMP